MTLILMLLQDFVENLMDFIGVFFSDGKCAKKKKKNFLILLNWKD